MRGLCGVPSTAVGESWGHDPCDSRAQDGRTPLMNMGYWGIEAVLRELLAARADVNAADKVSARAAAAVAEARARV